LKKRRILERRIKKEKKANRTCSLKASIQQAKPIQRKKDALDKNIKPESCIRRRDAKKETLAPPRSDLFKSLNRAKRKGRGRRKLTISAGNCGVRGEVAERREEKRGRRAETKI